MAADVVNPLLRELFRELVALLLSPGIGIQQDGTQLPALVVQQGAAFPEGGDAQGGHGLRLLAQAPAITVRTASQITRPSTSWALAVRLTA